MARTDVDILRARKKAKKKSPPPRKGKDAATPEVRDPAAAKAAPPKAPTVPPPVHHAKEIDEVIAEMDEEKQARLKSRRAKGQAPKEIDEAIAEIEKEQKALQPSAKAAPAASPSPDSPKESVLPPAPVDLAPPAPSPDSSVAEFLETFPAAEGDEEATYRHGFARKEDHLAAGARHLSFRLGKEEYALELASVRETIKVPQVTEVPLNPPYVAGVVSIRGAIVPVIDLRRRLGIPAEPLSRKSRIVVAGTEQSPVGLLVDEVRQVITIRTDAIEPPPAVLPPEEARFLLGVGRTPAREGETPKVFVLLNFESVARIEREEEAA
ncbi:MAG: chemotaxis protein CheW [Bdellovibrionota bacterium]